MKKIKVKITGETPLLMNSPKAMIEESSGLTKKTQKQDMEKEAKKLAYTKKSGELYIPSSAIKGSMVGASAYKKAGKFALRPLVAGGCHILPNEVGLNTTSYKLDIRTVVIQRNRVVKARPRVENWKAEFEISYDETLIANPEILREVLEDAGRRVGLLDFRPAKLGSFGMFTVTEWKEV